MRPDALRIRLRTVLPQFAVACAASLLGACATLGGTAPPPPSPAAVAEAQAAQVVAGHLDALQRIVQGSPAEQAELLATARSGYESGRGGSARLRYALLLACPAHPARDATLAQTVLREALSAPEQLTTGERALALVELQRVDAELRQASESQRLAAELDRERGRSRNTATVDANARRLQAELEENAKLRKALDEARAKLDAIANIERNITDRKPPAEGRRP